MSSNDDGQNAVLLILVGCGVFYRSFKTFKLRRRIGDTPRSKIASAAIGRNVEIYGKILCHPDEVITSPLSSKKVASFIWELQELQGRNKNTWTTVKRFYSTPFIYLSDDGESIAAVDLASCEFHEDIYTKTIDFDNKTFEITDGLKDVLLDNEMLNIHDTGTFFNSKRYRLREGALRAESLLYVFGTAHVPPQEEKTLVSDDKNIFGKRTINLKDRIARALNQQLKNPKTIAQFDKNKDGALDKGEEEVVYRALEKKAMSIVGSGNKNIYLPKAKILLSVDNGADEFLNLNNVFVSTTSKSRTTGDLTLKAFLKFVAGPLMIAAGVYVLYHDLFPN